ncbi:MAG: hypothetical protein RM022_012790 [Nostoc sp. EfeVER01]|uniref:hypothetical protein n=1 Tax=Nostoc sp. EfeVER01 TaxID=3075406 RepID=UPI002AD564EE|nr:hypothetical protein [Nostoc sp. EfeVER01]MDZ7946286.1 hypothetical protein [Nostoc sp. EfeVER01]
MSQFLAVSQADIIHEIKLSRKISTIVKSIISRKIIIDAAQETFLTYFPNG